MTSPLEISRVPTPQPAPQQDREPRGQATASLVFVAWGAVAGRSAEIADALGGRAFCLYPPSASRRPPVLVRYVAGALRTWRALGSVRPDVVVVTNPPVVAGLVVLAWARLHHASAVLDSHPAAFGAQGDRVSARLLPIHRWMVRRVRVSLVAAPKWAEIVESWGGRALVVHEAPGRLPCRPPRRHSRLRVLCVGRLAPDEPFPTVLEAAREVPHCDVLMTGDAQRCPEALRHAAPPNVHFVGFLDPHDYTQALEEADVVMTLTTEPDSVMRAAYEAVYAHRPLIISDWPIDRELFPEALHVAHDPTSIARAIERMDTDYGAFARATAAALARARDRWEDQRKRIDEVIGLEIADTGAERPANHASGASRPASATSHGGAGLLDHSSAGEVS